MYLSRKTPKNRIREAQRARENRAEIRQALTQGQITKRDLFKWGLITSGGMLAAKHGLSPFAKSAYGGDDVPTGTPPSPLFGVDPNQFTQELPRLRVQKPESLKEVVWRGESYAVFENTALKEPYAKRLSWHTNFTTLKKYLSDDRNPYRNKRTKVGPMEGRPPGENFAHQRWNEFFPKKAYVLSLGQVSEGTKFHPGFEAQNPDSVWTFDSGHKNGTGVLTRGVLPPPLIKVRYGEPVIFRNYNDVPISRAQNGGFGRNEFATHNHNAHNSAASDGANNAHFFPGQFYDYLWGTTLARHDIINTDATNSKASGPDDDGGYNNIPGDYRELQSTLWFHDHRFFFTADNVYKGHLGMLNYYSGPDYGNERTPRGGGVNHRLPSGWRLPWGNIDFDVNLMISDMAFDPDGQYFFDIFDTDGFLGDLLHVNFAFRPYLNVLPRKYRFRLLCASMSRFIKLALVDEDGNLVPFDFIANDGNFLPRPIRNMTVLDQQGVAERYDIVVDFSKVSGNKIKFVNLLEFSNGRGPDRELSLAEALSGTSDDPAVGAFMEFRIVSEVESVDEPGAINYDTDEDQSRVRKNFTKQIFLEQPVREREIEFKRGSGSGECFPDCGDREIASLIEGFAWSIRVNGESTHFLNANRISNLIPRPGEVEHWTLKNGGGGWDHPIHLHFEEGVTIHRGGDPIPATERLVRKDVWRLRAGGEVKFQVRFGEYGGAYVNHCHNTVHEDNAMLLRYDILTADDGSGSSQTHINVIDTPVPTPEGVTYRTPEILPEGNPLDPGWVDGTDA